MSEQSEVSEAGPVAGMSDGDAEARRLAEQIHELIDTWRGRLVDAVRQGRAATAVARMGTARTVAELRHVELPAAFEAPGVDENSPEGLVAEYLRQTRAAVLRAAHEIERNRYSLEQLQRQLEKLDKVYERIVPPQQEEEAPADSGEGSSSPQPPA